ncbi:MAG: hypothetical protein EXX96DRAFT_476198 [Benjaminiella poitrasii]|nr:MAG: hypothetical protein EXX96DRAFT_476198 [Benjaminiella poitrasii]
MKAWNYLSGWTSFALPKNIQKRLYKFVLRRAIGQFLQNELDLENFDIALINGNLELRDLDLNLQFINKLLNDTPFVLEKGSVAIINASIPWSKLLSGDISLKIQGLHLSLRPVKKNKDDNKSLQQDDLDEEQQEDMDMERLQILTKVIDKMLSRVKIDIIDTIIRISHKSPAVLSTAADSEYHVDISIPRISYFDETPEFNRTNEQSQQHMMESSILLPPVTNETIKIVTIASPQIWIRESPVELDDILNGLDQTEFFEANEGSSTLFQNDRHCSLSGSITPKAFNHQNQPYEALLFTTLDEKNWVRLKLRPSIDNMSFMSIKQIDFLAARARLIVSPQQIAFFMDLIDTISSSNTNTNTSSLYKTTSSSIPLPSSDLSSTKGAAPALPLPLEQKIKVQMPLIELFLLSDDRPVLDWEEPGKQKDHVRFAVEQFYIKLQKCPNTTSSSIMDIRMANIILDEWIAKPAHPMKHRPFLSPRAQTQYEMYVPIFQFDSRIKHDYDHEDHFPTYYPYSNNNHNKQTANSSPDQVRIHIEKKQGLSVNPNGRKHSVFDDLETQENIQKRKVRVRCAFIRILINAPDMSQISRREEFNDRFHESQLSVDVKKLVSTWCSTTTRIDDHSSSFESDDYFGKQTKKPNNKLNIELNYVNVFIICVCSSYFSFPIIDEMARCWFTAKTVQETSKTFAEETISPSIEITIQDANTVYPAATSTRSGYFGAGSDIPDNLFNFLSKNESFSSEQKLHIPMDEQAESAMVFKQRTIETSMFSINCHLPQADMNLTKQIWDKVQIIQNDLLIWQPKFLLQQQQQLQQQDITDIPSPSSLDTQYHYYHRQRFNSSSSMATVMSNGNWNICTSPDHTYRLQFSEFKYFAAMKHLGKNENITTLDIEEFDLFDVQKEGKLISLLFKTIPKKIHPKRNTSMVSLISKVTSFPELNKINKQTSVVVCNLCWKASPDIDFITQLVDFQKVPDEMVFIDPPTQYTKVYAHVLETSIDYVPIYSPSRAVIIVDGIEVITDILAGQPMMDIKTFIQTIELYLIDDRRELKTAETHQSLEGKISDARKYWTMLGFSSALAIQNIELLVKLKLDALVAAPLADISLVSTDLVMGVSADAFQTLLNLFTYVTHDGDRPKEHEPALVHETSSTRPKVHQVSSMDDMLASIDEAAFKSSPTKISPPTLIDAPEMEEFSFVEEFYPTTDNKVAPPLKPRRKNRHHRIKTTEDIVRLLIPQDELEEANRHSRQLNVIEDFFGVGKRSIVSQSPVDLTKALLSLRLSNVSVIWKLYDGYEWDYVRADMATREALEERELSFKNPGGEHASPPQWKSGGKRSSSNAPVEINLTSIALNFDLMPDTDSTAFYFHLLIRDVEVIDNIKSSAWKKFLGYMRSGTQERERDDSMVNVELISLRPVQGDPQQELRLSVKLLPIRLYIDQDAMSFLQKFFLFDASYLRSTFAANQAISPKMTASENKYVDIYPITLKVDYKPKVFNLKSFREGQMAELMNIFRLDGAELSLSRVKLTGINGLDSLLNRLNQEWLPHILNTQKIKMVSGVSPVRSLTNLSTGVADLVLLPIQQYRKDGRLMKGIQRGTSSFARATAVEAIKFSSKMASGTQVILEHADGFFSSGQQEPKSPSSTSHLQQLQQDEYFGYTTTRTAQTIFAVPTDVQSSEEDSGHQTATGSRGSSSSSHNAKAVIRAVPIAVIKPMIGLTDAFQNILTGLRNSIDPVMRLQSEDVSVFLSLFFLTVAHMELILPLFLCRNTKSQSNPLPQEK